MAIPAASTPSASSLATSNPFLTPPDPIIGPLNDSFAKIVLIVVGNPQSPGLQNRQEKRKSVPLSIVPENRVWQNVPHRI